MDKAIIKMQVWVDADACPRIARDLIIKTSIRTQTRAIFVANKKLNIQSSPYLEMKVVGQGFDVADDYIIGQCRSEDLVLTNDIPLASEVLDKLNNTVKVMNYKGHLYTSENIKQALNMRDFMETMRGTGVLDATEMGGQKPYSDRDKKAFADGLNRLVC